MSHRISNRAIDVLATNKFEQLLTASVVSITAENESIHDTDTTDPSATHPVYTDSASTGNITSKEKIDEARRAIDLCQLDYPDRAERYMELARLLWKRHKKTGENALLTERIEIEKQMRSIYRNHDPRRCASSCRRITLALRDLYKATKKGSLLDEAIAFEREELLLKPDDPCRASPVCRRFAQSLVERFSTTGYEPLLDEAILFNREAFSLCPQGHRDRAFTCGSLALSLRRRFEISAEASVGDEAIELLQEALSLTSSSPMTRNRAIESQNLAYLLWERFQGNRSKSYEGWLDECIILGRQACDFYGEGHPDRAEACTSLALYLTRSFKLSADDSLFREAVALRREVLSLRPLGHRLRAITCDALADLLRDGFEATGDHPLLDEAIALGREAISLASEDHPNRRALLNCFAHSLMLRFNRTGDETVLDEAIELKKEVLALAHKSNDGLGAAKASASLSWSLMECKLFKEASEMTEESYMISIGTQDAGSNLVLLYKQTNDPALFSELMRSFNETLSRIPEGHPYLLNLTSHLALIHLAHFKLSGNEESLDQSILLERKVVSMFPPGHPERAYGCFKLASSIMEYSSHKRDYAPTEESMVLFHEALETLPQGHPTRWKVLIGLVKAHLDTASPQYDIATAIDHLGELISLNAEDLPYLLSEIAQVLKTLNPNDVPRDLRPSLLRCYLATIDLSSLVAGFVLDRKLQLRYLLDCQNLGPQAYLCASVAGEQKIGIVLLERARGIMWSQALHVRDPQLQDAPPALASELEELLRRISVAKPTNNILSQLTDTTEQSWLTDRDIQHQHGSRIQDLIRQIRATPGHEDFMRGPSFEQLVQVAAKHPVVVLVAVQEECHALILRSGDEPLAMVKLDNIKPDELTKLSVHASTGQLRSSAPESKDVEQRGIKVSLKPHTDSLLKRLWTAVVKPVIDFLQLTKTGARHRPRIHWCPTGAFAFLPLHAAGIYELSREDCCSNYAVSSYTPTLAALLRAQRAAPSLKRDEAKLILVAAMKAHDDELPNLWNVADEVRNVARAAEQAGVPVGQECVEDSATVARVASSLESATFAHIACHGIQDREDALSSGFCLSDGDLTVTKLMELDLKSAFFTFLSACETAKGDDQQPDQTVHLAATMLFVGFRSVVATMWAMNDADGPRVAKLFYEKLFCEDVITLDAIPYALDYAVWELRASGVPPERWAPFVHIGA